MWNVELEPIRRLGDFVGLNIIKIPRSVSTLRLSVLSGCGWTQPRRVSHPEESHILSAYLPADSGVWPLATQTFPRN